MQAVNVPLLALFGLAYGLGHPSVAPFRPAAVDKTLASFHNDVNRTAKELSDGARELMEVRLALAVAAASSVAPAPAPAKVVVSAPKSPANAAPPPAPVPSRVRLTELPRAQGVGFSAPPAR